MIGACMIIMHDVPCCGHWWGCICVGYSASISSSGLFRRHNPQCQWLPTSMIHRWGLRFVFHSPWMTAPSRAWALLCPGTTYMSSAVGTEPRELTLYAIVTWLQRPGATRFKFLDRRLYADCTLQWQLRSRPADPGDPGLVFPHRPY